MTVSFEVPSGAADMARFLVAVEFESARLEEQIEAARTRGQRARTCGTSPSHAAAELDGLVLGAQRELERMEREHREAIRAVRAAATAEVERLFAAARDGVLAMRANAAGTDTWGVIRHPRALLVGPPGSPWPADDQAR